MRLRNPIAVTLTIAAALAGGACGGDGAQKSAATPEGRVAVTPESKAAERSENKAAEAPAAGGDVSVDRAFVEDMIPHHESAVEMAEIALERAESDFVRRLARDIIAAQEAEIALMRRIDEELAAEAEPGDLGLPEHAKGMHGDPADLRGADAFDAAFVDMMIPHHQGAIVMARVELERGSDPRLRRLARQIIEAQRREITAMQRFGAEGGPAPDPSGSNRAHPVPEEH